MKLLRFGRGLHAVERRYANLAMVATIAAVLAGVANVDLIVARVMCVVCGLAAVETLLALVLGLPSAGSWAGGAVAL